MTDYDAIGQEYKRIEAGASTIASLLQRAGLFALPVDPGPDEVDAALRKLRELTDGADPLRQMSVRRAAVVLLNDRGVKYADRLVGAAFKLAPDDQLDPGAPAQPTSDELFAVGQSVLDAPDILVLLDRYLHSVGYAGDTAPPKVIYLAITSRLLARPTNLVISGPSAGGKNHTVAVILPTMPSEAYYSAHGQSPLAVMYSAENFAHRTLIISEAAAFHEDGIGASLLRGLAWDNELNYDTVIDGKSVHLHKDGPTGLITTSTRDVEAELGTRTWTVLIPDDPEQTRKVLRVIADAAAGHRATPSIAAEVFIAAQRWLAAEGVREVVIPFATTLGELVPNDEVRVRRDFTQLLTLIQAHAVLHQRHRERDDHGRVVATLDDYEHVRAVVESMFALSLSPGLSKEMRDTVNAVAEIVGFDKPTVTSVELAARLKLSESATWRRVQRAVRKRYLINDETRKGQPAKLRLGSPLPTPGRLLPLTSEIRANAQTTPPSGDGVETSAFARPFASEGDGVVQTPSGSGDAWEPEPNPDEAARAAMREGGS